MEPELIEMLKVKETKDVEAENLLAKGDTKSTDNESSEGVARADLVLIEAGESSWGGHLLLQVCVPP